MPHTDNVQEFVERLGDFYEVVDDDSPIARMVRNASPKHGNTASPARPSSPVLTEGHVLQSNGLGQQGGQDMSIDSSSNSSESSPNRVSSTASLGNNSCQVFWVM